MDNIKSVINHFQ